MASTLPVNGSYGKTSLPWPLPEVWKGEVDKGYFCDDGKETLAARVKKAAEDGGAKLKIEKLFHHGKELDMDKSLSSQGIFRDPTLIEFKKTSLKAWLDHVGIDVGAEDSKDGDGGGAPRPARALERQDSSAVRREQIHDHEQVRRALGVHFDLSRRRSVPLRTLAASLDRYDERARASPSSGRRRRVRGAGPALAARRRHARVGRRLQRRVRGRLQPRLRPVAARAAAAGATVAIFGDGPLTWRTYALVRLEERVRIQEGHCDDFEDFDFEAFAREAWTAWLDDGGTRRSKGFDAASPARAALVDLCLDPFRRLDGIKSWDFEEPASVGIPTLVLLFQLRAGRSEPPAICKDRAGSISSRGEGARFTAVMILLVIYFYAVKVIPDAYCKFLETGGGGDGVARLAALRALIFRAEVDSVLQKVGFRVWRVMNGGYEVLLDSLNLYVLFYHHSPLEVILNSLAIEFILEIDERLADPKGGYDPDLRYPVPKPTTGLGVPTKLENSLARSNQSRFG
ncbi:RNA cap guanine-N2 methyltransferase [Aureococcus anophagefferens]|nr:RNA cap guanine-N2 methyltransferase [Aureococcus anophagefferens]